MNANCFSGGGATVDQVVPVGASVKTKLGRGRSQLIVRNSLAILGMYGSIKLDDRLRADRP